MNKRKKTNWGLFLVIIVLIYFTYLAIGQQKTLDAKALEIKSQQEKLQQETITNEKLNKQIEILSSDEYIEKVAREKLGMVKKGERVFLDAGE